MMLMELFANHQLLSVILGSTCVLCWSYMMILVNLVAFGAYIVVLASTILAILVFIPIAVRCHDRTILRFAVFRGIIASLLHLF